MSSIIFNQAFKEYNILQIPHFRFGGELSYSCKYSPDIFFLSVFLFFGTFFLCTFLKKFKYTPFFPTRVTSEKIFRLYVNSNFQIRSLITDYAVILTIIVFVLIDSHYGLATPKLIVPTVFKVGMLIMQMTRARL